MTRKECLRVLAMCVSAVSVTAYYILFELVTCSGSNSLCISVNCLINNKVTLAFGPGVADKVAVQECHKDV